MVSLIDLLRMVNLFLLEPLAEANATKCRGSD